MPPRMNLGQWRQALREQLTPVAGDLASFEADRLLGEVLRAGPTELTVRHQEVLTDVTVVRLEGLIKDRLRGRPLAYVIGHVEFCGLDLRCDERALIPRPETEGLVEVALQALPPSQNDKHPLIIDVGTGSGNIALAMAHARPDVFVVATDTSAEALNLARENRDRLGLVRQVSFARGDALSMFGPGCADMVVSNPPYVRPGDPNLDRSVAIHEPAMALYSGPSGIEFIAGLLAQSPRILRPGAVLVSEIGYDQAAAVRELVSRDPRWGTTVLHRDLAGVERVLATQSL